VEELAIVAKMMGGVLLYAVRVFDSAMAHPDLMRLMAWFSLEQKADSPEERGAARDENVAALTAIMALHGLDGSEPLWFVDPDAHKRSTVLRRNIREAVRLLSESTLGGG
jgi:hypothetical protein